MCSKCGHVKDEMKLSERIYKCDKCGLEMDRDQNASHNLMTVAASLSETLNACGETSADLEAVVFGRPIKVKLVP
jgi:putative transposase